MGKDHKRCQTVAAGALRVARACTPTHPALLEHARWRIARPALHAARPARPPRTRQQVEGRDGKRGGGEHNVQADQAVAPRVELNVDVLLRMRRARAVRGGEVREGEG